MNVRLVLALDKIEALKGEFGNDRIVIIGDADNEGYCRVEFEVRHNYDVLSVLHAGVKAGLDLGLYGPEGKPKQKVSVTVA